MKKKGKIDGWRKKIEFEMVKTTNDLNHKNAEFSVNIQFYGYNFSVHSKNVVKY